MSDLTIANVGEKLCVGQLDMAFSTVDDKVFPGTAVINGPCYIGLTPQIGVARATCMIGPPLKGVPVSLEVTGWSNFAGITNTAGTINDLAVSNIFGFTSRIGAKIAAALNLDNGIKIQSAVNISQGPKVCQAVATVPLIKATQGVFGAIQVIGSITAPIIDIIQTELKSKKPFDIPHPTKEGWRLRHVCIEGPSADVYVRGRLNNSNVIELPEYWRRLVDPETITVNLTPVGSHQELYVDKIEWGTKILIKNNCSSAINCYYTVYGERADTDKNIPEYEGTYNDYPGDNNQYTSSGTAAIVQ
jgi:hypothetical protein